MIISYSHAVVTLDNSEAILNVVENVSFFLAERNFLALFFCAKKMFSVIFSSTNIEHVNLRTSITIFMSR